MNARRQIRIFRRRNKLLDYLTAAAFLAAVALISASIAGLSNRDIAGRAAISDGDSLTLGDLRMRLEGIDAPELDQQCRMGEQFRPCGLSARERLRALVKGRPVRCSGWQYDRYERLLVRCHVDGNDINREMVRSGWAIAYGDYEAEEAEARDRGRGIWAGDFVSPREWRDMHGRPQGDVAGHLRKLVRSAAVGLRSRMREFKKWLMAK